MQNLFDTSLIIGRRLRALRQGDPAALFLMRRIADDLEDRLSAVGRRFDAAITAYCYTDDARRAIIASGRAEDAVRLEADGAFLDGAPGLVGEPANMPLEAASADLAVSLLSLHEMNDLPGVLIQLRRALRPDGLFLAAFPGAGTLSELRESLIAAETELHGGASPRVIPFTDIRDAGALLQRAGLALPVSDIETLTVRYDTMFDLIRDLRAMGATNALADRSRKPATRRLFQRAAEIYAARFSDVDGRVRATFAIVWLSGWAPSPSQQKPLRPGSATVSLKTILEGK